MADKGAHTFNVRTFEEKGVSDICGSAFTERGCRPGIFLTYTSIPFRRHPLNPTRPYDIQRLHERRLPPQITTSKIEEYMEGMILTCGAAGVHHLRFHLPGISQTSYKANTRAPNRSRHKSSIQQSTGHGTSCYLRNVLRYRGDIYYSTTSNCYSQVQHGLSTKPQSNHG